MPCPSRIFPTYVLSMMLLGDGVVNRDFISSPLSGEFLESYLVGTVELDSFEISLTKHIGKCGAQKGHPECVYVHYDTWKSASREQHLAKGAG